MHIYYFKTEKVILSNYTSLGPSFSSFKNELEQIRSSITEWKESENISFVNESVTC